MKGESLTIGVVIVVTIIIIVFTFLLSNNEFESDDEGMNFIEAEKLDETKDFSKLKAIKTDKPGVEESKIMGGGPGKGGIGIDRGIPALAEGNIKYVSVEEADAWIEDDELVLALEHKGVKRVYPLQIMVWHEIANDVVAGDPVVVTYCPLCGSGIAYYRVLDLEGEIKVTRFGTSGKLFNSNLVMYDDKTDSYWQQIDGNSILGEQQGYELKALEIDTVVWRDWKRNHPNSEVLSKSTGINRRYGNDPYGNYYENSFLLFDVENEDSRVSPKTVVFGIEVNGEYSAYRESDLIEKRVVKDRVGGEKVKIERMDDGKIVVTNSETGEEIVKERDFWFAWYAFHPETKLYGVPVNEGES